MTDDRKHRRCHCDPRSRQQGTTLIEVMIAVLVFSIGVLGLAGLQLVATRSNHDAMQRTTATMLANSIIERMRQNPEELVSYVLASGSELGDGTATLTTDCRAVTCTAAQLAVFDLWSWDQELAGTSETRGGANVGGMLLPTGCINSAAGGASGQYTISIAWRGTEPVANPTLNNCGSASGNYGASNEYRRLITVSAYLSD